jgi:hypothetical protein
MGIRHTFGVEKVHVGTKDFRARGTCSCGWASGWYTNPASAQHAAQGHYSLKVFRNDSDELFRCFRLTNGEVWTWTEGESVIKLRGESEEISGDGFADMTAEGMLDYISACRLTVA